jgi:hypothetical protein
MNASLLTGAALGAVILWATSAAPVSAYQSGGHGHGAAQNVRNHEPPDPCLRFHERRAHAHCVSELASGRRQHDRLDPYKN